MAYDDETTIRARALRFYRILPRSLRRWITPDDLMQEGHVLLREVRRTFDPDCGTQFTTYLITALDLSFKKILEHHAYQKRDCFAPTVELDSPNVLESYRSTGRNPPAIRRAEFRMEMQAIRRRASPDAIRVIDFVLNGETPDPHPEQVNNRLSLNDASRELRMNRYRIKQAAKEIKKLCELKRWRTEGK